MPYERRAGTLKQTSTGKAAAPPKASTAVASAVSPSSSVAGGKRRSRTGAALAPYEGAVARTATPSSRLSALRRLRNG